MKRNLLFFVISFILLFVACVDSGLRDIDPQEFSLSVTPTNISIPKDKCERTINIETNDEWTIIAEQWISLSQNEGSGSSAIVMTFDQNNSESERTGKIIISGKKCKITQEVVVTQSSNVFYFSIDPLSISTDSEILVQQIVITSNDEWNIYTAEDWIDLSITTGYGDHTLSATIAKNDSEQLRNGYIEYSGKYSGITGTITVSQSGTSGDKEDEWNLNVRPSSITTDAKEKTQFLSVTSNDDWSITSEEEWISFSDSIGSGSRAVAAYFSENQATEQRIGQITIRGVNSGITQNIQVKQYGASLYVKVSPSDITLSYHAVTKSINVESNDSWTISNNLSWITVSRTEGTGNNDFSITTTKNDTESSRSGIITVKCTNSDQTATIHINQKSENGINLEGFDDDIHL